MATYNTKISQQLSQAADIAQQWILTQKQNGDIYNLSDPDEFFNNIRTFSKALENFAELKKTPQLEWRISLSTLTELAQLITAILSELTQGRSIACLILLRSLQEIAHTARYALNQNALIEWHEYSIRKDMRDIKTMKSILKDGLDKYWPPGTDLELAEKGIQVQESRLEELKSLHNKLGKKQSGKQWSELKDRWEPSSAEFAKRLRQIDTTLPLENIQIASWLALNGYVHARSRDYDPYPPTDHVLGQLLISMVYLNYLGEEFIKKLNFK